MTRPFVILALIISFALDGTVARAQCTSADIMEPGFNFITSSRGCAPFTIEIQTLFLNSTPGTIYHVDWGDGSGIEDYVQVNPYPNGPIITHLYANAPIECGYQVTIAVENACNPTGSVDPVVTNVIVWTDDIVASAPNLFRVCQGFAASIAFDDNSNWNCFPREDLRENADPRWIQWLYGEPANTNRISGITVDGVNPGGTFPYYNPAHGTNPVYPVIDVDQASLNVQVPVTDASQIGNDFIVTLNNWNTCNAYDINLSDGNPLNPATPGGDHDPRQHQSRIVIVETPNPTFISKRESDGTPATDFCIGELILFDNETVEAAGADLNFTWQFYDGPTSSDDLLETKTNTSPVFSYATGGQKLVRLTVGDNNAVGGCQATVEQVIRITPTAIAQIGTANTSFCKAAGSNEFFTVTFTDETVGSIAGVDEWAWELYDENDNPLQRVPASGYNSGSKVSVTQEYTNPGIYRARLTYRDIITKCDTYDEISIVIYNNPTPSFSVAPVCEGIESELVDASSLDMVNGNKIAKWEWDFSYDSATFNPDDTFDGSRPDTLRRSFSYGTHEVALRVTNDQNGCNAVFSLSLVVNQNPEASFTKDIAEGCSPLEVNLENTAVLSQPVGMNVYTWCIDYGDGYIDTLSANPNDDDYNPVVSTVFENWSTQSKNFKVLLKAESANGCYALSQPDSVKVLPSIKPGFNYVDYKPLDKNCSPVEVNFQVDPSTMVLKPQNYTWTISDHKGVLLEQTEAGSNAHFKHTFTADGNSIHSYSINLQASITDICTGDSTLTINVNPMPSSEFSIDTLDFNCEHMVIELNAAQKGLVSYDWKISNGGILIMTDTLGDQFTYLLQRPESGRESRYFQADLTTENYAFCQSEESTHALTVRAQPNLKASFMANPEFQVYPEATVSINNLSSRSSADHDWDFGDGHISTEINPDPHTYAEPGHYDISLHLEEDFCSQQDTVSIYIQPASPKVDFAFAPPKGCVPLKVSFTNLTKYAESESYVWYFGEGESISTSEHPTHTYYEPGTYSVRLEATNATGVSDMMVKKFIIEAHPNAHADFTVRPEKVKLPEDPIYTTNLSFDANSYIWDFGDGAKSTEIEPSHVYTDTGRYDIMLIAMNEYGCADTLVQENIVEVVEGNEIRIPNAFTPSLDGPTGGNRYSEGRNDVFYPITEGVIAYHMQIYNRWGELLFDTTDSGKGWDGYYQGRICPPDVYVYKIDFKFLDGKEVMKFGDVALIR